MTVANQRIGLSEAARWRALAGGCSRPVAPAWILASDVEGVRAGGTRRRRHRDHRRERARHARSDVVVIAVKPAGRSALAGLPAGGSNGPLWISIAAGVRSRAPRRPALGRIVRDAEHTGAGARRATALWERGRERGRPGARSRALRVRRQRLDRRTRPS
jgi:hypothetical protein